MVRIRAIVSYMALAAIPASAWAAEPEVVGYVFLQSANATAHVDASRLTRINCAFANIEDGKLVPGSASDAANYASLTALRQQNPKLKILVSAGGWLWSTNFSDMALTPASRAVFIDSAVDFVKRYDLDGLDLDWEYPGLPGNNHPFRAADKQNFTALLRELRQRFDQETSHGYRRIYLTIAAGATNDYLENTEMAQVQKVVDSVNLMAYDFVDTGSDHGTGHNAPLYRNPAAPRDGSDAASVQAFLKAGVPAAKLYLGLPFYGRIWAEVSSKDHGLFQPGKSAPQGSAGYQVIADTMLNHGYVRYWDSKAAVPYLYNADKKIFVTYDDAESLTAKVKFARSKGLGGVMFWEYSNDPSGTLLKAVDEAVHSAGK
jgi:chitinase